MTRYIVTIGKTIAVDAENEEKALESAIKTLQKDVIFGESVRAGRNGWNLSLTATVVESPSYGVTRTVISNRDVNLWLPKPTTD